MKLHLDLIRRILLEVETLPTDESFGPLHLEGWSLKVVSNHVQLLARAKLLKSFDYSSDGIAWCIPLYLTEAGGSFLDAIRSDRAWEALKQPAKAEETAARQTLQLLRQIAASPDWQESGARVEG